MALQLLSDDRTYTLRQRDPVTSSLPLEHFTAGGGTVELLGHRPVSYAKLVESQSVLAAIVGRLLRQSVRVPLKAFARSDDGGKERLPASHELTASITEPWPRASRAQLAMAMVGPLLVHGNATLRVVDQPDGRLRFTPRDWRWMRPLQPAPTAILGWETQEDGVSETMGTDEVIHLRWWSPTGPLGVSPLRQLGTTIRLDDAAQRYAEASFRNGARPGLAVILDQAVKGGTDRTVRDALREEVDQRFGGDNAFGTAILGGGVSDLKEVGHSAVEAELTKQREVNARECAAVYGMHPSAVGLADTPAGSDPQQQREHLFSDVLGPTLILAELEINAWLRAQPRFAGLFVEHDFAGVLRGDLLREVQALRLAISSGLYTPNEGRDTLNMPRSDEPGADALYLPANNLRPLGSQPGETGVDPAGQPVPGHGDDPVQPPQPANAG